MIHRHVVVTADIFCLALFVLGTDLAKSNFRIRKNLCKLVKNALPIGLDTVLVVLVKSILLMTSKYIKKSKPRHPKEFKMMFNSEAAD